MEFGIHRGRRVTLNPAKENLIQQLVVDGGYEHRLQRDFEQFPTSSDILQAVDEMCDQLDKADS